MITVSGLHWKTFRYRLSETRRDSKITQAEFEVLTGRSRVQLSNLETGVAEPGILDFLTRFCQVCDRADPAYILGLVDFPRPLGRVVAGIIDQETSRVVHVMNGMNETGRTRVLDFALSEQAHSRQTDEKNQKIISLLLELIAGTGDSEATHQAVTAIRASGLISTDPESLLISADRDSVSCTAMS